MTLPSYPNQITLLDIQTEFGGATPIGLNEYYADGAYVTAGTIGYPLGVATAIPSSGAIAMSNFHGAQSVPYFGAFIGGSDLYNSINLSIIQLLSLTNETTSVSSATFSPGAFKAFAGASALSLMYTIGYLDLFNQIKNISKYLFTTDTSATTAALNGSVLNPSAIINNTGQFFYWPDLNAATRKFTVSTETEGSITAIPLTSINYTRVSGYNTTYGWLITGVTTAPGAKTASYTTAVQKMGLSNETFYSTSAVATNTNSRICLTGPTTCVWQSANASSVYIWEKLTYSTDTVSAGATMSSAYKHPTDGAGADKVSSLTKGYFVPELNLTSSDPDYCKYIGAYTYSTDTLSIAGATFGTGQTSSSASQSRNP